MEQGSEDQGTITSVIVSPSHLLVRTQLRKVRPGVMGQLLASWFFSNLSQAQDFVSLVQVSYAIFFLYP